MNDFATPEAVDAIGIGMEPADASPPTSEQLVNLVTDNPLPAVLAAAAVGAGLMALATLMVPSKPSVAKVKAKLPDGVDDDVKSLRSQLADLAASVLAALPDRSQLQGRADDAADDAKASAKSAREALSDAVKATTSSWKSAAGSVASSTGSTAKAASESIRSALGDTWSQASDALQKYQPQVDAVAKIARQNPIWAAVLAGAAGTLIGWQLLGASKED